MNVLETDTAHGLFDLFLIAKKKFIEEKKIIEKKDKHIYPIKNTAFEIPKNWVWCYLSDLSIIQEGPGIRKRQYENEGVQFLTVTNILEGSVDLNKSKKYISISEYEEKYKHFTIDKGDIVTACSGGSWGKSSFYDLNDEIILNTSTLRLRFFNDLGDNKYLYYLTKTSYFKGNLSSHSTGQQANYGYSHYSKIPIPLPPLSQQKQIVAILDKAFAAIDTAKANAEQNLQNAKELFESYLQNVFENKGDDWVISTIGESCNLMTGGTPSRSKKEYFDNGTINWLVSGDINKKIINDCDGKITELGFENSSTRFLPLSSVMIALNGQGKTRGTVAMLRIKAACNQSLVSIYPKDDKSLKPELVYANLEGRYNEIRKITGDGGNDRRGLNMPLIRKISFSYPKNIIEQGEIIAQLDALRSQTKKLESIYTQKIADLEEMKKSILQKAFSGQLNAQI